MCAPSACWHFHYELFSIVDEVATKNSSINSGFKGFPDTWITPDEHQKFFLFLVKQAPIYSSCCCNAFFAMRLYKIYRGPHIFSPLSIGIGVRRQWLTSHFWANCSLLNLNRCALEKRQSNHWKLAGGQWLALSYLYFSTSIEALAGNLHSPSGYCTQL